MKKRVSQFQHRGNKMHFISLGCPRNLVDTEVMLGILLKAGYEVTDNIGEADHIIINTCGFLEASRAESLSAVEEVLQLRKKGAHLIVTGCMVQTHQMELQSQFPKIDAFLGSGDVESILKAVEAQESVTKAQSYLEAGEVPRQLSTPSHFAYLKIAEGCRKRCAYCIIPTIKGPLKSKSKERIIKEFRTLLDQGVKEIILIAQDLGDWGKDQGFKRSEGLVYLLEELLKEEGDFWIRLLYLYPDEISLSLIELIKSDPRICPYLDMPIQHINDQVLKRMHRATSKKEILETITTLRREIPEIAIRTSLIVGFPGETEEQFEELISFIQEYPLDQIGIFAYSQEAGSIAATLPDQIPEEIKRERQERLALVQQEILEKRLHDQVGKILEVVVEGYHPDSELLMVGRHKGQCPDIDSIVILNDHDPVKVFGNRYQVKITGIAGYDLVGQVLALSHPLIS
jgi:ribosomal protein S12 methylthiotransferase